MHSKSRGEFIAIASQQRMRDVESANACICSAKPGTRPIAPRMQFLLHEGGAEATWDLVGEVPELMEIRPLSLRAFDALHCAGYTAWALSSSTRTRRFSE
jgi:hypothetical protein